MTVTPSINPVLPWFEQIDGAEPDVLRSLLKTFVEAFMSAEADAICGAPDGVRSEDRLNPTRTEALPLSGRAQRGHSLELAAVAPRHGPQNDQWDRGPGSTDEGEWPREHLGEQVTRPAGPGQGNECEQRQPGAPPIMVLEQEEQRGHGEE